ncbi:hypothetical protein [Saccharomonospora marina]|nr:hypothetical protein [Saccharomonospora marina]
MLSLEVIAALAGNRRVVVTTLSAFAAAVAGPFGRFRSGPVG